jgi:hypothetical protein
MTGRPPATGWGTAITPAQNSYPAYANILAATAHDTYGIYIYVTDGSVSGTPRDIILKIGIDHAGGTTYTDSQILHLLVTSAGNTVSGGITYYFPIYIPSGSTLAASASCNSATLTAFNVGVKLYGKPTHPELVACGTYVTTFGDTTASSSGTAITSGTTSEGGWTEVTAGTTTNSFWWFQVGFGIQDTTITSVLYAIDVAVGDATNKHIIFQDEIQFNPGTAEEKNRMLLPLHDYINDTASGIRIYVRVQCSGTADSALSVAVYALGG